MLEYKEDFSNFVFYAVVLDPSKVLYVFGFSDVKSIQIDLFGVSWD